jgi:anthranilate synthase/aminodeoxychorismate synthase-like glutamine amidotransferase
MQILLVDNHDSFTWNLVGLLRSAGKDTISVIQPENIDPASVIQYDRILFSPGPGLPQEQPAMFRILEKVEELYLLGMKTIPVLGVCLGLQAMALHYGAGLINLPEVVHGQPRKLHILRPEHPLFRGIRQDCEVGLYHSWAVDPGSFPASLQLLATDENGTVMAVAHKTLPVTGVQFHPESIMTRDGERMIGNWISAWWGKEKN